MVRMKIFPGGHSSVLHWKRGEKKHMTFGNIVKEFVMFLDFPMKKERKVKRTQVEVIT